jgi:DNA-binding NtrC family response regulator
MWSLTAKIGSHKGASWDVTKTITLGRSSECDVSIVDPGVSREHCRLTLNGNELFLEDLGSTNGTIVNGEVSTKCVLDVGDELMVGTAAFIISGERAMQLSNMEHPTPKITQRFKLSDILNEPGSDFQLEMRPRSYDDLVALHTLSQSLSSLDDWNAIAEKTVDCLNEHLEVEDARIVTNLSEAHEFDLFRNAILHHSAEMDSGKNAVQIIKRPDNLVAKSKWDYVILLFHGDRVQCSIFLQWRAGKKVSLTEDLGFGLSIGGALLPHLLRSRAIGEMNTAAMSSVPPVAAQHPVGTSAAFIRVKTMAETVSKFDIPVLIQGDTGTGKEVIARYIHSNSPRRDQPFVAVNCAAVPETLFESEFFGHEKGSFTGAEHSSKGFFQQADGGTLFLDEVGELSLKCQAALLRAVDTKEFQPIGLSRTVQSNVRIITATNSTLLDEVHESRFREDLYYRLTSIEMSMPLLRDRDEDIQELADYFIRQYCDELGEDVPAVDDAVYDYLKQESWHGNVRELRSTMQRLAIFCREHITVDDVLTHRKKEVPEKYAGESTLEEMEIRYIREVLKSNHGRLGDTASALGVHRNTLRDKMARFGIEKE